MPEIEIKNMKNKSAGKLDLPEGIFALKSKDGLLHDAVLNTLANQRQGTHATKTRGMVRGGGTKPYKQKGTGRSRAGSIRSPIRRGGGTIFGPSPRDYSYSMPRKAKKAALFGALSRKFADGELLFVDALGLKAPKTSDMVQILNTLELAGRSLLLVLHEKDDNVRLSARNIPGVNVKLAGDINAYDVLKHERLLITKDSVGKIEARATA